MQTQSAFRQAWYQQEYTLYPVHLQFAQAPRYLAAALLIQVTMAKRSANFLVAAVVACVLYALLPSESFVAPQSLRGSAPQTEAGALAQAPTFQTESRSVQVSMAATGGEPTRFPLVFLGLLAGTAAVGLLAVFFYGSYSGAGSGL